MRVKLAGPVKVYAGQRVDLYVTMKPEMNYAHCAVYASCNGYEPSPYVDERKLSSPTKDKKPMLVSPELVVLTSMNRWVHKQITPEETTKFYIMQEIDVKGDPLAKARIRPHGKIKAHINAAFRWLAGR